MQKRPFFIVKESMVVAIIFLIPAAFVYFLYKSIVNFLNFWETIFELANVGRFYSSFSAIVLTVILLYILGRVLISKSLDWFMRHMPILRKVWLVIGSVLDKLLLTVRGGYKRIMYEHVGMGTEIWSPAFVVGKTIFNDPKTNEKRKMLVIVPARIVIPPTSFWIPAERTRIVDMSLKVLWSYVLSGGLINPDYSNWEEWTEKKYNEIPDNDNFK